MSWLLDWSRESWRLWCLSHSALSVRGKVLHNNTKQGQQQSHINICCATLFHFSIFHADHCLFTVALITNHSNRKGPNYCCFWSFATRSFTSSLTELCCAAQPGSSGRREPFGGLLCCFGDGLPANRDIRLCRKTADSRGDMLMQQMCVSLHDVSLPCTAKRFLLEDSSESDAWSLWVKWLRGLRLSCWLAAKIHDRFTKYL